MAPTSLPRIAAADEPYDHEADPDAWGDYDRVFENPLQALGGFVLAVVVLVAVVAAAVLAAGNRVGWAYAAMGGGAFALWQLWRIGPGR